MAKKRKRRRPQQRPRPQGRGPAAAGPAASDSPESEHGPSKRAERKEEARRERERRIKQARRRRRNRRLIRWGIAIGVVGGIAGGIWLAGREGRERQEEAAALARTLSCTEVEEQEAEQPNEHQEPYAQGEGGVPAFGGNHTSGTLPADPKVYEQQPPEETAIHNLEHGYVLIYYAAEADNALDEELVTALEDVVNDESEVVMAPYAGLSNSVYFVAWGARQGCDPPVDAEPQDLVTVAEAFIEKWKNAQFAPEAAAG